MSDMTLKSEMVVRAKTLHRKAWLNKFAQTGPGISVYLDDLVVGPVTVLKSAGAWSIIIREGGKDVLVYDEPMRGDIFTSKPHLEETLKHLRAAMILDDLASIADAP